MRTDSKVEPVTSSKFLTGRLAAVVLAAVGGAAVHGCFFAMSYVATGVDKRGIEASLREAWVERRFPVRTTFLEERERTNAGLGVHAHLECGVMAMAIREPADRLSQAITPLELQVTPNRERDEKCESLYDYVHADRRGAWKGFYRHRYLHGLRPITVIGASMLGVAGLRDAVKGVTYGLVLVVIGLATIRAFRAASLVVAGQPGATGSLTWFTAVAVFSGSFAVLAGVPLHAMTVSHGIPLLVLFTFLLLGAVTNLHDLRRSSLVALSAVFGAIAVELDYLIGLSPTGLALLIAVLAVQPLERDGPRRKIANVVTAALAYVVAAAVVLVGKQIIAAVHFGPGIWGDLAGKLSERTGVGQYPLADALGRFYGAAQQLALGHRAAGRVVLIGGLIVGAAAFVVGFARHRGSEERTTLALLALSAMVIVLWYALFWNHAAQHAYFMVHLIGWPIAAGLAAGTLGLLWDWRSRRWDPVGSGRVK